MNSLPPMQAPRPNAGASIDWDKPVGNSAGYAHAGGILALLARQGS